MIGDGHHHSSGLAAGQVGQRPRHACLPFVNTGFSIVYFATIHDLVNRIGYAAGTIRNLMSDGVFKISERYVKPRERIFSKWRAVRGWLEATGTQG